jgi:hypothetical protein
VQVRVDVPVPPAARVTEVKALQRRPVEGFAVRATVPAKPFKEATVTVEVPEFVARIAAGDTAPVDTLKLGCATVPYVPPTSGIPAMLSPKASKRAF